MPGKTQAVNSYQPNADGLYNMHGNVMEWCADFYKYNYNSNPTHTNNSADRVARGGSWESFAENCRSATRFHFNPGYADDKIGFRLAFAP